MKKRNKLFTVVLVLALSMVMTLTAGATESFTGTYEVTCQGVRFTGDTGGDAVVLQVGLNSGPAFTGTILQNETISVSGSFDEFVPWKDSDGVVDGQGYRVFVNVNGVNVIGEEGILDCPPPPGGEGCTPGYWKNHLEDWAATGFSPGGDFDTTFVVDLFNPDITLLQAVNAKGGGVKKLARHGTAALLSAAHPDVAYPFTVAEVKALVQAGDADSLATANELGCDIP